MHVIRDERVNKHNKDSHKHVKPPSFILKKFMKDNLHELFYELIWKLFCLKINEVENPEVKIDSDSALLANYISANIINLGNILKLERVKLVIKRNKIGHLLVTMLL